MFNQCSMFVVPSSFHSVIGRLSFTRHRKVADARHDINLSNQKGSSLNGLLMSAYGCEWLPVVGVYPSLPCENTLVKRLSRIGSFSPQPVIWVGSDCRKVAGWEMPPFFEKFYSLKINEWWVIEEFLYKLHFLRESISEIRKQFNYKRMEN